MADSKISLLTSGTPARTDELPYADLTNAQTKSCTFNDIVDKSVKLGGNASGQSIGASDTYLTGSGIALGSNRLLVGSVLRWTIACTKTAAGTVAPIWSVRFGTAGTTADAARITLTGAAQSAAIDTGVFEISVVITTAGASGVARGLQRLDHNLSVTGFSTNVGGIVYATSAAFDMTTANLIAGISVNPGTSAAWTVQLVMTEAYNLA